jgi:ubiquinone biosynthesis protein Coq4
MEVYDEDLLIKDALLQLFQRFRIPENAYTAKNFVIKVGKLPVPIPNIQARVKVARFHDIHHILTGYPASWTGEAEIGAWEIATGCRRFFIAWFLNSGAVLVGLLMHPKAVIDAFRRGRKTRTNLYHNFEYEALLNMKVKDLRREIGLASV